MLPSITLRATPDLLVEFQDPSYAVFLYALVLVAHGRCPLPHWTAACVTGVRGADSACAHARTDTLAPPRRRGCLQASSSKHVRMRRTWGGWCSSNGSGEEEGEVATHHRRNHQDTDGARRRRRRAGDIVDGQHSNDTDDTGDVCTQLNSHLTSVPWSDSSVHLAYLQCHA